MRRRRFRNIGNRRFEVSDQLLPLARTDKNGGCKGGQALGSGFRTHVKGIASRAFSSFG
jgi:hypothetical protein